MSGGGKILIEELRIREGEETIYGVLYRPERNGQYPALIMSHGYNGSCKDFDGEGRYFAEHGMVVYAYDFCGGSVRSRSTGKTTDMTLFTEKANLLEVYRRIKGLDFVEKAKVFLFGASQGGMVTALAAEELLDEIPALALYFPAFCIADDWTGKFPLELSEEEIPETVDFWGMKIGRGYFTSVRGMQIFETIGGYQGKVLILYGDRDPVIPMVYMTKAQEAYSHARLVVLPGEGHGFSPAGAQTAREQVLSFLRDDT